MADHHSSHGEYHKGEMDTHEQASTFDMFVGMTKWGSLALAVGLVFFVILFAVKGGDFFLASGAAFAIAVVGWFMLKKNPNASH